MCLLRGYPRKEEKHSFLKIFMDYATVFMDSSYQQLNFLVKKRLKKRLLLLFSCEHH